MISRRHVLIGLIAVFALVLVGMVVVGLPALQNDGNHAEIEDAVLAAARTAITEQTSDQPVGDMTVSDVTTAGAWAFGLLVTRAPDPALEIHAEPDLRLFITRREESTGQVKAALEYTPEFYARLDEVPEGLIPQAGLDLLRESQSAARGEAAAVKLNYALPWRLGETWLLTGAPHPDNAGERGRPWSAIDFAYDPGTGIVTAIESGVVWRSTACPNFIRIDHAGGYRSGYYHVIREQVKNGQMVMRGDAIASEGMATGCGGYASGPHVHLSLRYFDMRVNMAGNALSGWMILDSPSAYNGCMVRVSDNLRRCTPRAQIPYDEDVSGVARSTSPHDYNFDGVPDIWVVNQRPEDGGTVTFEVFDGRDGTTPLPTARTSLPPQPVELNTTFAVHDYNFDGVPDLWLFHRRMDTSETTALRIIDGANPQYLLLDTPTALPPLGDEVRFAVADFNGDNYPDIYAVMPDTAANTVRIQVVNGADFAATLAERTAALDAPDPFADVHFAVADHDGDSRPDLWMITPRSAADNAVRVKILSGNGFQTVLVDTAVAIQTHSTYPNHGAFVVADSDGDGTPDIRYINTLEGQTLVVSGEGFATLLFEGQSAVRSRGLEAIQVVGADRARLRIPPQAPAHVSPDEGATVQGTRVTLRFTESGLAESMTLHLRDAFGMLLAERRLPPTHVGICTGGVCAIEIDMTSMALDHGQAVYWSVTAENPYGQAASGSRGFTVEP